MGGSLILWAAAALLADGVPSKDSLLLGACSKEAASAGNMWTLAASMGCFGVGAAL